MKDNTLLKFIIYMAFLLFVIALIFATGSNKRVTDNQPEPKEIIEEKSEITLKEKEQILISGKYNYEYKINNETIEITYTGLCEEGICNGFREYDGNITKYNTEEIVPEELYTDLHIEYFNFKDLFDKLNSSSTIINRKEGEVSYKYTIDNTAITVYTDDEHINKIEIDNEYTYVFKFTY